MLILSKRAKEVFYLLVLFVSVLLFLPGIKERFAFIFQYAGDQDRFIMWKTAFAMIRERPFLGKGIGTFMANFHTYCWYLNVQYAHNCFLQIWAETGIFSLLSFLLFLTKFFSSAVKSFRKNQNPVILGLTCGLFAYLITSFFDTNLYSLQLATLFWSMAGFTLAIIKLENQALLPTNKSNGSV
jgi:O-antigen ligase